MTPERQPEIAKRAYEFWEMEGRPDGRTLDHWLRAEWELTTKPEATAMPLATPRAAKPRRGKTAVSGR